MKPLFRQLAAALAAAAPVLATAIVLCGDVAAQGETAFTRGKGKLDVVLSWSRDWFDDFQLVGTVGMPEVDGTRRDTYALFGAYGLTDDIDLIASAAYVDAQADAEMFLFPDEGALQDLILASKIRVAKRRLGPGELSLAALPGIKVPLTDYATYEENPINAPGHGQVDLRLRLVGQYQLDQGHWVALETGFDKRFEEPADEFPINLTVGVNVLDRWTLSPFMSWVTTVGDDDFSMPVATSGVSFFRYGIGTYVAVTDWLGLTASYRRTDEGRNDSQGVTAGLVLRF